MPMGREPPLAVSSSSELYRHDIAFIPWLIIAIVAGRRVGADEEWEANSHARFGGTWHKWSARNCGEGSETDDTCQHDALSNQANERDPARVALTTVWRSRGSNPF